MCIVIKMTVINHTTTTNNKEHIDSGELHKLLLMFIKYDIAIITLQFNTLECMSLIFIDKPHPQS